MVKIDGMSDVFSNEKRSQVMALIRSTGNKSTELATVTALRRLRISGWRRNFPLLGSPDLVFPKEKVCVFLHGCFWHGCYRCYKEPRSNKAYWRSKIIANRHRDRRVGIRLRLLGWTVLTFWECDLRPSKIEKMMTRLERVLRPAPAIGTNLVAMNKRRPLFRL